VEPVAGFLADELNQLVGVAQFTRRGHPGGQIAAQGDDAVDADRAIAFEDFAHARLGRADAGQMRRGGQAGGADFLDGLVGAVLRRAAGAEVTEKKAGFSGASFVQVARNFSAPSGVCGGKNSTESSMFIFLSR